ncbi:MAG: uroporphyrinogen-III C-methyltransferase [Nostocaceae cyanobacterium]|nr:uroporphyrinogen-III C-methyltransferase [Nostocaceae cyanobacterium]
MTQRLGKVYLVGAGLGNVTYLTVRAHQLLAQAEVLVYDALVDRQLLQLVSYHCLHLDVGKRGGKPSTNQIEINKLLVQYCQEGKQVIRLKSGDPFIFGRSAAEIEALIAAGCNFEVVPGISSALAAPLLAGIPLTDPVMSRCFGVLTAHQPDDLDWEALSRLDTLVILMGGKNLAEIVHQLVRHGRSPHTPVAVIRWGGTPQQQIWTGQLGTIVQQTTGVSLSPAVIVVGEVVGLRTYLQVPAKVDNDAVKLFRAENSPMTSPESFPLPKHSPTPLLGNTILVTRAAGQSSQFSATLTQLGANVVEMPALLIVPPSSWAALDSAIAHLAEFDWLILTSNNAVDYFFERLLFHRQDTRSLATVKIAVVGEKTAQSLQQRSLCADFIPPNFVADSLVANFPETLMGKKVLFPRVETGGRDVLVKELTTQGADVLEVAAYESSIPTDIPPAAKKVLLEGSVNAITFASSKTVKNFCSLIENLFSGINNHHQDLVTVKSKLHGVCIASIGPQTSKTCLSLLGRVDIEAEEYTLDGLTAALVKWASQRS